MFDEHTFLFSVQKIEISYKGTKSFACKTLARPRYCAAINSISAVCASSHRNFLLHKKTQKGKASQFPALPFIFYLFLSETNNIRMAFNTASTMTPTSAKMAAHIFAIPKAPKIRHNTFTPMAK